MKYTRRTFIDVSSILNQFENSIDSNVFQDLVFEFSEFFAADNPNFDENRFWDACVKSEALV